MTMQVEKLRGSLSKDLKSVTVTIPLDGIDYKHPKSISSRGYAGLRDNYFQFEVDVDEITLPVDGKIGMYISPRNWKAFKEQFEGKKEGKKAGTNTPDISPELMDEFKQFLEFKKMMATK